MSYIITQEIHPNNETRLTLYRERRKKPCLIEQAAIVLCVSSFEVRELARSAPESSLLLDIRPEFKTPSEGKRFHSHKRTAFGLDARRRISRAAGALDRLDSDVSNYLFLTATLPGNTAESKWAIAEYAHEIINGLKAWFSKRLLSRNEFYVWEHQRRGALHFHYCIHVPDKSVQQYISANFKAEMVRLYDGIQKKHDCNLWGKYSNYSADAKAEILQARVEIVYKSVGSYMAGYLAGKGDKHSNDKDFPDYPKRWFGVSRPLSELIKTMTEKRQEQFTSFSDASEAFHSHEQDFLDEALTDRFYSHQIGEGKTHVFYHLQQKQLELWQSKAMLTHKPDNHPNIYHFIQTILKSTHELLKALQQSKSLREKLPNQLHSALRGSTFKTSLNHGVLKKEHLITMEKIFSSLDFSSSSCRITKSCFSNLLTVNLMYSHYYPQIRYNQFGVVDNPDDFSRWVDKRKKLCYRGTTANEAGDTTALDGSRGHVPCELGAPSLLPEQLCLTLHTHN